MDNLRRTHLPSKELQLAHTTWVCSLELIHAYNRSDCCSGCFLGAIMTIWLGDLLGRRRTIFLGSAIMVVGATLQTSAFSLPHLIVGRIVTGIGNGMNTSTGRSSRSAHQIRLMLTVFSPQYHHGSQKRRNLIEEVKWSWLRVLSSLVVFVCHTGSILVCAANNPTFPNSNNCLGFSLVPKCFRCLDIPSNSRGTRLLICRLPIVGSRRFSRPHIPGVHW